MPARSLISEIRLPSSFGPTCNPFCIPPQLFSKNLLTSQEYIYTLEIHMRYDNTIIRRSRMVQGLSIAKLAKRAKVAWNTVRSVEDGIGQHPETVKKLADALWAWTWKNLVVSDTQEVA